MLRFAPQGCGGMPGRRHDAMRLYQEAAAQGICIAPGPLFSADRAFRNCLRLNYSCPEEARVEHALAGLGRLLSQQRGPP